MNTHTMYDPKEVQHMFVHRASVETDYDGNWSLLLFRMQFTTT